MLLPVIFEDSDIVVINKPSGVVVHPFDFSTEETILDLLHENYPDMFSIENEISLQDKRVVLLGGIVHKLDRDTSGVLVIAKNQQTFDELRKFFTDQQVEKTYIALVRGIVQKESFTIDAPLGRNKKDYKQSTAPETPRGSLREAVTDVRVLKRNADTTLVQLTPRTGRTHQLRAHMASIGHPILGDMAYGHKVQEMSKREKTKERIMLHAQSISFMWYGEKKVFESPLPEEFDK